MVELRKNYRFGEHSGIDQTSRAVKQGDGRQAMSLMKSGAYNDIRWIELSHSETIYRVLKNDIIRGFRDYLEAVDRQAGVDEIFDAFDAFRVLCALREGPFGVNTVNAHIEKILLKEHLIKIDSRWYTGRPIMVTRNDYQLKLFNGDVGIIMPDRDEDRQPRAFFRSTDGHIRKLFPQRLPQHETVYAMTVHKSQGSEFNEVLFVLSNWDSPLLTRELIYTGITRARTAVKLVGDEGLFRCAVSKRI
jgi:exodeoxyribonuclease V alpha subunit